jgi:hypothetical protein
MHVAHLHRPDSAAASVTGTCTDRAGNVSAPLGYGLRYDATPPTVTGAAPERPPSADGWFNRPVRFDIHGSDATSGIADCPAVTYQLKRRWRYGGRSWRLEPGRYRWLVWPGFGARSEADYGRRIGPATFRVAGARRR